MAVNKWELWVDEQGQTWARKKLTKEQLERIEAARRAAEPIEAEAADLEDTEVPF